LQVFQDTVFTYKRDGVVKEKVGYYLDGYLLKNLEHLKEQVKNKYDGIFAITGNEGTGKTSLSHALGYFLNPNLDLKNIVFSGQELMDRVEKAKKGDVIIYDEAITALGTQDASSEMQQTIIKVFTTIRSKGLYIIILLPNPFMLRRYFFVFRTKFLIHTYSTDGINRGFFKFYSYKRKKIMYLKGCKEWNMNVVQPNFVGRFTNTEGFFIDPEIYEAKKAAAIKSLTTDKKTKEAQLKEQFEDAKLKLKIQIEQWKQRYQDKCEMKFAKLRDQHIAMKEKYKTELLNIKQDPKDKYQPKIQELERKYSKVLYYFFERERDVFERNKLGKDYSQATFVAFLNQEKVLDEPLPKVKPYLQSGEELLKLSK